MHLPRAFAYIALVLFSGAHLTHGARLKGIIKSSDSWLFLDKFVFNPSTNNAKGNLKAELLFPIEQEVNLLLYFKGTVDDYDDGNDEFNTWDRVFREPTNCAQKRAYADYHVPLSDPIYRKETFEKDGKQFVRVKVERGFVTSRPRWFFIAVGNCLTGEECTTARADADLENPIHCAGDLDIQYDFKLTNGEGIDMQFSADEQGVLQMSIGFTIAYAFLMWYTTKLYKALRRRRKFHTTVQMLVLSTWLAGLSSLFLVIFNIKYAKSGLPWYVLKNTSEIIGACAEFVLILQVILVAKGWTIVRRKISAMGRVRIATYMTFYIAWYCASAVYYSIGLDAEAITYVYDTPPGYVLVALRCMAILWLFYAIKTTTRKYQTKKRFFIKFKYLIGAWLATLPLMVVLNTVIPPVYRAKILFAFSQTTILLTQTVLVLLYHPEGYFSGDFPFHATTATMLSARKYTGAGGQGGALNSKLAKDNHLRQAAELSRRIRKSVRALEQYSADLNEFLEAVDPAEEENLLQDEELEGSGGTVSARQPSKARPGPGAATAKAAQNSALPA